MVASSRSVSLVFFIMSGVVVGFVPCLMSVEVESSLRCRSSGEECCGISSTTLSIARLRDNQRLDNVSSRIGLDVILEMSGVMVGFIPGIVSVPVELCASGSSSCRGSSGCRFSGNSNKSSWGKCGRSSSLKRVGLVVVKAEALECISNIRVSVAGGIVRSGSISSLDAFNGVIRILVLSSRDVIEVSRLVAHLVLRPSVSMVSGIVRFNPAEAILDRISGIRSW